MSHPATPAPRSHSLVPVLSVWLLLPLLGALVGACYMVETFGLEEHWGFHPGGWEHTIFPPPTPAEIERWNEEDHLKSMNWWRIRSEDKFWRAYTGPLSDLDRVSLEGHIVLVALGVWGGLALGCAPLLPFVPRREIVRQVSPWARGLAVGLAGTFVLAWFFKMGGDYQGLARTPSGAFSPLHIVTFSDRLTGCVWLTLDCAEPRKIPFWFRATTVALGALPGVFVVCTLLRRMARCPSEQKRWAFLTEFPADLPPVPLPPLYDRRPGV